ncbi:MAG: hypothetical protein RLZZ165_100, partial [Bacteroidota bacterium]
KVFPRSTSPSPKTNAIGERLADLSLIYRLDYANNFSEKEAILLLQQTGIIEYAEPAFIYRPFYDPSDPDTTGQYYLRLIQARRAWDVSHGDSTIKIGIIDTGGSFTHPDYAPKIAKNHADPIDGIDNDNNGYLDDFQGWDFGGDIWDSPGDNVPQWAGTTAGSDHGVLVGGAAAAATDNGINVAAIGFDCSILPVKVSINEAPLIYFGYQGVVYAADMGAQILNLSWGGGEDECRMCEEAIRYAVVNKGALVVAAAGNTPQRLDFYPASHPLVISVAGTQQNDLFWATSPGFGTTWSYLADLCAPSRDILTTTTDAGTYAATGTSLGAPIVCGIAGLVKERFPSESMRQIGQRVRMGADENVYAVNGFNHLEQMGKGRADAWGALTYAGPSVRAVDVRFDTDDGLIQGGDTILVRARFVNFLAPVNQLQIGVSAASSAQLNGLHGATSVESLGTMDTASTWVCPFRLVVRPNVAAGTRCYVRFGYSGEGGYVDDEYWVFKVQPSYVNLNANRLETSINGSGRWGFMNFPSLTSGNGLLVDGQGSLINDAGFLVGKDSEHVSNNFENSSGSADNHFMNVRPIQRIADGPKADLEATAAFSDASAGTQALGLLIGQHSYQWSMDGDDDYIIQEYTIKNTTALPVTGLYAGMYFDFDGYWRSQNQSRYDPASRTIYNMDTTWVNLWDIGLSLLTPDSLRGYAADVNTFGYSIADKWNALSSPPQGANLGPLNLAQWVGAGPFTVPPGDSHIVAFAIVLGDSLDAMRAARQAAYDKYWCVVREGMNPQPELGPDILRCGSTAPVPLDAGPGFSSYVWSTGATTPSIVTGAGSYWVSTTDANGCGDYDRITVTLDPGINAAFTSSPQGVIHVGDTVRFSSTGHAALEWCWDWGDGAKDCPITSTASHVFMQPGTYTVCLVGGNGICTDTACQALAIDHAATVTQRMSVDGMEVYPVPLHDLLHVRFESDASGPVMVKIIDLAGRSICERSLPKAQYLFQAVMDVSRLQAGVYFLEVSGEIGKRMKRILVE